MYGYYLLNRKLLDIVAVIGFDTDFLIFDFHQYFELTSMRCHRNGITFTGYHHRDLLCHLHVEPYQLPRVASILGCDVVEPHPVYGGDVYYAAKVARSYPQITSKNNKKPKKTKSENSYIESPKSPNRSKRARKSRRYRNGYSGYTHHTPSPSPDRAIPGPLARRFQKADTFYSGVAPLDILPHPWLIMLLFQDYQEASDKCTVSTGAPKNNGGKNGKNKKNKNKKNENTENEVKPTDDSRDSALEWVHLKGVLIDIAMDDLALKRKDESSAVLLQSVRKWIYIRLLNDDANIEEDNDSNSDGNSDGESTGDSDEVSGRDSDRNSDGNSDGDSDRKESHQSSSGRHDAHEMEAKHENVTDSENSGKSEATELQEHGASQNNNALQSLWRRRRIRMREVICWPHSGWCFKPDIAANEWRKGIDVDLFGNRTSKKMEKKWRGNPLLKLESYKYIKNLIEMETDRRERMSENSVHSVDSGDTKITSKPPNQSDSDDMKSTKSESENEAASQSEFDDVDKFEINVPAGYLVLDVVFLLKYLRGIQQKSKPKPKKKPKEKPKEKTEEESKESTTEKIESQPIIDEVESLKSNDDRKEDAPKAVPFVFGGDSNQNQQSETSKNVENVENGEESKKSVKVDHGNDSKLQSETKGQQKEPPKKPKKTAQKHKKRINGRLRRKKKSVSKLSKLLKEFPPKNKKKSKPKPKPMKRRISPPWSNLTEFIAAFLYQWEYRDLFVAQSGAHKIDEERENNRREFREENVSMSARSMHIRTVIHGLYEIIFVFLQIEFGVKWFGGYYRDSIRYCHRGMRGDPDSEFMSIPKMKLEDGVECRYMNGDGLDCECQVCVIRDGIHEWKERVKQTGEGEGGSIPISLHIPFVWDVLNTKLFHWFCSNPTKAKCWINDCLPDEL